MKTFFIISTVVLAAYISLSGKDLSDTRPTLPTTAEATTVPDHQSAQHDAGEMALGVTNRGCIGTGFAMSLVDGHTGHPLVSCDFPKGSGARYLFGGTIWVGGVVGTDTLVSVGADGWFAGSELNPDISPFGYFTYRSIDASGPEREGARSNQDFITEYFDTCDYGCPGLARDPKDNRPHVPLGIRIDQRSYVWKQPNLENAVIFDMTLTNISNHSITNAHVGIYIDADVGVTANELAYSDDVTGFFSKIPLKTPCPLTIDIPCAWIADNDGDFNQFGSQWAVKDVTGTALLRAPSTVSYNWWVSNTNPILDFGPMRSSNYRDFGSGGTGTPIGDRDKYWTMSNGDIDYDQIFTATITPGDTVWNHPIQGLATDVADGYDTRYLLSVGPFQLNPGESVPLVFAYVAGAGLHSDYNNIAYLPSRPDEYMANLDFSDLKTNALWASLVYDNPGVDTDSDGFAGPFVVCGEDTVFTTGDGVPDFRASEPPTRPIVRTTVGSGSATMRWNGAQSEASRDFLTGTPDFEGYNVYLKRLDGVSDWGMVASYDVEDYFKAIYDAPYNKWRVDPHRFTGDELRCLYAHAGCSDSIWSTTTFVRSHPYVMPGFPDSMFYFVPAGCNAHLFGHETPILKSYPNAPKPQWSRVADVPVDSLGYYVTDEGYFKYYEYELTLTNLTPADTYLVSVTALDFGKASLTEYTPLETPVDDGQKVVVPLARSSCCSGMTGNVDCSPAGSIDIADLTALIDYLYVSLNPLCCVGEANIDGDPLGVIDIADLTRMIDFLYVSFTAPAGCE